MRLSFKSSFKQKIKNKLPERIKRRIQSLHTAPNTLSRTPEERLKALINWSNDPNAYATLQPNLTYFDHPHGYIAFRRALSGNVVLSDPIIETGKEKEVLEAFLKSYPRSIFSYASDKTAAILAELDSKPMRTMYLGVEHWLDLSQQNEVSKPIASALKKADKAGLSLKEIRWSECAPEWLDAIQALNQKFIADTPAHKEMGFISRAIHFHDEVDVRPFLIFIKNTELPIGFLVLDPWYEAGKCIGYQLHQFRLAPTKLWGVYFSVVAKLTQQLRDEGYRAFSLGGSTIAENELSKHFRVSKSYNAARKIALKLAKRYHPMTNQSQIKLQFTGHDIQRYLIAPHKIPLLPLLRLVRANNISFFPKRSSRRAIKNTAETSTTLS